MPQFPAVIPLSSLDGSNGFQINGETTGDESGFSVSTGDVNADGFADIIIGAPYKSVSTTYQGASMSFSARHPDLAPISSFRH
jgi:hypothetical protein